MNKSITIIAVLIFLVVACSDNQQKSPSVTPITAPGVTLVSHSVEVGSASPDAIETGLRSAVQTLSELYMAKSKEFPTLSGRIRGTFHIEPDGTVRMFASDGSEFIPKEGKSISEEFIGATFGKRYHFPELKTNVLLKVDFQLKPE